MSDDIKEVISTLARDYVLGECHPLKKDTAEDDPLLLLRGIPLGNFKHAMVISTVLTENPVSVGSGDGAIEKLLFFNKKVVCVDPNPGYGYSIELFIKPEFDFTASLVKARPSIVSDCSLWLFWPNPACFFCQSGTCVDPKLHHVEYDFEAIQLLNPKMITMLVSLDENASGSKKLSDWVRNWENSDYELIFSCSSMGVSEFDMKLYPFVPDIQFFCFVKKEFNRPLFKALFLGSRSTFYTKEDYWKIRNSMDPHQLIFSPEEKKATLHASVKMLLNPTNSSSNSTAVSFREPTYPLTPKEKKDNGLYFRFD